MADNRSILIKVAETGLYIAISTYCREIGRRGRFLLDAEKFSKWLAKEDGTTYCEADCGNFIKIHRDLDLLYVQVAWLNDIYSTASSTNKLNGFRQNFTIPVECMREKSDHLYRPQSRTAAVRMSHHVNPILTDKLTRRAFSKAMRECFQWGKNDMVTLYPDGGKDFIFENYDSCRNNRKMVGGLILHETSGRTCAGFQYKKLTYSIHT